MLFGVVANRWFPTLLDIPFPTVEINSLLQSVANCSIFAKNVSATPNMVYQVTQKKLYAAKARYIEILRYHLCLIVDQMRQTDGKEQSE